MIELEISQLLHIILERSVARASVYPQIDKLLNPFAEVMVMFIFFELLVIRPFLNLEGRQTVIIRDNVNFINSRI